MTLRDRATMPAVLASLLASSPALAGSPGAGGVHAAGLAALVQDLGPGRGTLTTLTLDLQARSASDTWSLAPTWGVRDQAGGGGTALGGTLAWHRDWSDRIGTGSEIFVAEPNGPFARASLAQSLAGRVSRRTVVTATGRWSHYQGGQDVWFVSGEVRRYVRRGSLAYRLTWIKPADRGGFTSHLLAFTLNDARGPGRTQLWLSQGQASLANSQGPDNFRGQDRALQLRRVQPLGGGLSLSLTGGIASYDLPAGAVQSRNAGFGLSMEF